MLQHLNGNVYCWTERHGKPETTYYWNSFAIHIESANVLALVDPLPMSDAEIEAIEKFGTPSHILLTCNWHLRESEAYRKRWGCPIYVNELGVAEAETEIDGTFRHGERFWEIVEMIHLPDVSWKEDTGFLVHQEKGLLIVGDVVCGGRADVGIPDGEVGVYDIKYILDREKARMSLARLMDYPFDSICFGHGSSILHGAKAALQRFIDTGFDSCSGVEPPSNAKEAHVGNTTQEKSETERRLSTAF